MCQYCEHTGSADQSRDAVSVLALNSEEKDGKAEMLDLSRRIADQDYPKNAWTGKTKLNMNLPPTDPMEWELTNPETGLASGCQDNALTDDEPSTTINPYIHSVSYHDDESKYPHTEQAKELMRKVCVGLFPIMKREGWEIVHLTEFYPFEDRLWGLNFQQGKTILIRLRDSREVGTFLSYAEIMSTAIHEVCHNRFSIHDGDFYDLWDELNTWHGIPGGEALIYKQVYPKVPIPVDYVALLTRGLKILLRKTDLQKHFSNYADQSASIANSGYIELPERFSSSTVVRLAQLAKGLDPAVDKPLSEITNAKDYWRHDEDRFAILDEFQIVWSARVNASDALRLYLDLYVAGEALGWHTSSKQWVLEQFGRAFAWEYRYIGGDFRFLNGPWTEPKAEDYLAATFYIVRKVHMVYRETTVEHQALRDVVVNLLREVQKVCQEEGQLRYDTIQLNELMSQLPELNNSLQSD